MALFNHVEFDEHEQVVFCHDKASGLKAIIAIHNTKLGAAVGGCRLWDYASDDEALEDVLRLSKGMTYKNALAGLAMGGGKSVIIGDAKSIKSEALFRSFGRFLQSLNGRYLSAEDVNITTSDIMMVHKETDYVMGLEGKSGNPGPFTALGTYMGMKAAAKHRLGSDCLKGIRVGVQGLGSVGMVICRYLHEEGAELLVTDMNQAAIDEAVSKYGATAVALDDIYSQDMDIYSPCALGATLNDNTIPQLKVSIIAGCANNQLAQSRHGEVLRHLNILYAPDYVINAGGIINVSLELDEVYDADKATRMTRQIYHTLLNIFNRSDLEQRPTNFVADEIAQEIISG